MANIAKFQSRVVLKHDTSENWSKATNFIPLKGEVILYEDTSQIKIGDGITKVNNLPFLLTTVTTKVNSDTTYVPLENELVYIPAAGVYPAGIKIGNGNTALSALPYANLGIMSQLSDDLLFLTGVAGNPTANNAKTYTNTNLYAKQGNLHTASVTVAETVQLKYDEITKSLKFVFE